MQIDKNTRVIARFHTEANGTGLNIYNPYFEQQGINAIYVLFKGKQAQPLVKGLRNLGLTGAITAGFEHDAVLPTLVDELSEAAQLANRIGIISNKNGKLHAHYQGGEGLLSAITEKTDLTGKRVVIVGAGTVAKTLLLAIEQSEHKPSSIHVVNRTLEHAEALLDHFSYITVHNLDTLASLEGDVLINTTRIGSINEDTVFTPEIVSKFQTVADVTFGDPNTNLITLARASDLQVVTGWDMFTHQAAVVLRELLDHQADIAMLRQHVEKGLATNNHGAVPERK